ncbi:DUF4129 domain-containing protein [Micromonospora peucetia]|uniref:DUF4129 domain-containing protein n=1 Tax=Micromonospora peucetia TaxID=47871 RepID=A0A1C6UDN4_9ACTN|nr:DUF4129 domain-containing protein [Micromonospora peucetia]WSA33879.1 DUF4129 domain-containing protein [Micromonospora peucetia]SCL52084.1 protein of unknown function (DUF4129) [Micromonospora peucetia]
MSFSRWWTETTAALGDQVPLPLVALLLVLAAVLVAAGWYTFPAWIPRRLPRLTRLRRRSRKSPPPGGTPAVPDPREPEPELPAAAYVSLADRFAAEGRYAEAVRERLRAMVRELTARRVVQPRPGMTVVELVRAATDTQPQVGPPLTAAGAIFSELWYGQRPASVEHDRRMREHAADLDRVLTGRPEDGPRP